MYLSERRYIFIQAEYFKSNSFVAAIISISSWFHRSIGACCSLFQSSTQTFLLGARLLLLSFVLCLLCLLVNMGHLEWFSYIFRHSWGLSLQASAAAFFVRRISRFLQKWLLR